MKTQPLLKNQNLNMRIIQITDLHIDQKGEFPVDIDVRKNFTEILKEVRALEPDHLVVTGDLCYRTGEKDIYQWIKTRLNLLDFPYSIIGGNHDDSVLMANEFEIEHLLTDDELFYAKKIGKTVCLFFDTVKGYHSEKQLNWIKRQLKNATGEVIIFMHHPPVKAGIPFMDKKHALKDIETIQQILLEYSDPIYIFCGHYHVEKTISFKNIMVQITPSCFFQMNQQSESFKVDHHRIALRVIDKDVLNLQTSVRYFDGNFK